MSGRHAVTRRERYVWAAVTAAALLLGFGSGAIAAGDGDQVLCQPGQELRVKGGGTWDCVDPLSTPTPTPSATQTASPSPTPSTTPSPTVTPTATTPAPTTPPVTTPPPSPTPTPTPTPTGPVSSMRNCFGDVKNSSGPIDQARLAACGYPTRASTGVPAGKVLTPYTGPSVISTPGTVIDGKTAGCLQIRATNVTIRNSRLTGPCLWVVETSMSSTLLIEDSELNCVDGHGNGLDGPNFLARRVYVHDCENAAEINSDSQIVDSYLSAREVGAGHADVIQSQGGNNVVIRHNTFAALNPITASIISNPTNNSGWLVEDNFFSAGAYTVYCPENVGNTWTVRNNRFYGPVGNWSSDPHRPAYGYTDGCGGVGTWTGNYKDNDGAAVNR